MAWNEPGGNNKDPWNSGGGQQPPDLDEIWQRFQQKFNGLFGGSSGGDGGGGIGASGIGFFIVVAFLGWLAFGIYIVEPAERAVILRFGKYLDTVGPGPHWRMPLIDTKYVVDVENVRSHKRGGVMLTQDENIVDIDLVVQYKIDDVKNYVLAVRVPDQLLKHVTESALRQVIGQTDLNFAIGEGRDAVAVRTKAVLQSLLDRYQTGLQATQVLLDKADPPEAVKAAFDDVIKAREDRQRLINEAEAYANQVVPVARGNAERLIAEAKAYQEKAIAHAEGEAARFDKLLTEYQKAPGVTRERLYLETVESVLTDTSKVMIDVEGGNNLLYIPLDRVMSNNRNTAKNIVDQVGSYLPSTAQEVQQNKNVAKRGSLRERIRLPR